MNPRIIALKFVINMQQKDRKNQGDSSRKMVGAANARNHGLDMATGEYICFID